MRTAEEILKDKELDIVSVSPDANIKEALQLMIKNQIGAILVQEGKEIVGIWTERDLMRNTVTAGFDAETAKIGDYMTTGLLSAPHDNTCYELLDKFLGMRLRHLLIKKNDEYIGLISIGDVIKSCLQAKDEELRQLNKFISWEYYENWRWKKK
jgi:signal-transduction protein with cAMP-binding, CBS, and nucleotidyltransferase domain